MRWQGFAGCFLATLQLDEDTRYTAHIKIDLSRSVQIQHSADGDEHFQVIGIWVIWNMEKEQTLEH